MALWKLLRVKLERTSFFRVEIRPGGAHMLSVNSPPPIYCFFFKWSFFLKASSAQMSRRARCVPWLHVGKENLLLGLPPPSPPPPPARACRRRAAGAVPGLASPGAPGRAAAPLPLLKDLPGRQTHRGRSRRRADFRHARELRGQAWLPSSEAPSGRGSLDSSKPPPTLSAT